MRMFMEATLQNVKRVPISKIQMISINYISHGITVYQTDDDHLTLREYFSDDDPDLHARIAVDEQNLSIRHGAQKLFGTVRGSIEIDLPRSFFGTLNIQTVSGKIDMRLKLSLDELNASTTSGKISAQDITAGSAVMSTVSGGIAIEMLRASCNLRSTSGAVRIECAAGGGMIKTVSGAIEASFEAVFFDLRMQTTSGRIRLSMPLAHSFTMDARSVSGGIHTDFPIYLENGERHSVSGQVGNEPSSHVELSTVSGKIDISRG